jgi:hypothetical protein
MQQIDFRFYSRSHIRSGAVLDDSVRMVASSIGILRSAVANYFQALDSASTSGAFSQYDVATAACSAGVSTLNNRIGISSMQEYDELRRAVDDARVKSEQARLALEAHVARHRC